MGFEGLKILDDKQVFVIILKKVAFFPPSGCFLEYLFVLASLKNTSSGLTHFLNTVGRF